MTTVGKVGITPNYQANSFAPVKEPYEKPTSWLDKIKEKQKKAKEYQEEKEQLKAQYENGEISKLEYYIQLIMLENPNKIDIQPYKLATTA